MDNINLENKEALQQKLETLRAKDGFICDMDGVIYHGNRLLPGVKEFVDWLYRENKHFLFLTNSSERSPKELQQKLGRMGLDVDESHFYTSALATARFISSQVSASRCNTTASDTHLPLIISTYISPSSRYPSIIASLGSASSSRSRYAFLPMAILRTSCGARFPPRQCLRHSAT